MAKRARHTRKDREGHPSSRLEKRLGRAFKLLVSATGEDSGALFAGSEQALRRRLLLLSVLADVMPPSQFEYVDEVLEHWERDFSGSATVTLGQLRASARTTLHASSRRASKERESASAVSAIDRWQSILLNDPRWRFLPAIVPGESPISIDQVFVELFAIPETGYHESAEPSDDFRKSGRHSIGSFPVVTAKAMASRTLEQCIVLGAPGSGKSTLLHWLARAVAKGECADFDAALLVKLSAYADVLERGSNQPLIEYFLATVGSDRKNWSKEAEWIPQRSRSTRRYLLLLDGWDEVPLASRNLVSEQIRRVQPDFITVITSRPTGSPGQLAGSVGTDFYRIAGLAPQATRDLIGNLLTGIGRSDLVSSIQARIEVEADFREMACNPFLLGLLVRVLVRSVDDANAPRTLASIYDQITTWMYEQAQLSGRVSLNWQHFAGLHRLSYQLLFERPTSA